MAGVHGRNADMAGGKMIKIAIHHADADGNIITLLQDLPVEYEGKCLTVPAGFVSDGASVPEFLWDDITPAVDPRSLRAALAHDFIYRTHPATWTRLEADNMFYDFIRQDGLSWYPSMKAYIGLRLFGAKAWEANGNEC